MKNNSLRPPRVRFPLGLALLLGAGSAAAFYFRQSLGEGPTVLLLSGALGLLGLVVAVWLLRVRAARRLGAALEKYALREISRSKRQKPLPRLVKSKSGRWTVVRQGRPMRSVPQGS